jgi:uncharacterized membrane protein (DUF106 family)
MATDDREQDYGKHVITIDVLKTWFPMGLTVAGLIVAVASTVSGMMITNSSRLARLETQVEVIQADQKELKANQQQTISILQQMYTRETRRIDRNGE